MNTNTVSKRARGVVINWPTGNFSVKDIAATGINLSKVSIQLKINKAILEGVLEEADRVSSGRGRKSVIYRKTTNATQPVTQQTTITLPSV
jgi:hypothetical protein